MFGIIYNLNFHFKSINLVQSSKAWKNPVVGIMGVKSGFEWS